MHASAAAGGVRGRGLAQEEFVEVDSKPKLNRSRTSRSKCLIAQCAAVRSTHDGERDDDHNRRDCERDPHTGGNGLGARRGDVAGRRCECDTAPITDAPVMSPRLRDTLSMPEVTPRWSRRISVMTAVLLAL